MLKAHQELAELLAAAEKKAVEITNAGGNCQSTLNAIREAQVYNGLRISNYKEAEAAAPKGKK